MVITALGGKSLLQFPRGWREALHATQGHVGLQGESDTERTGTKFIFPFFKKYC